MNLLSKAAAKFKTFNIKKQIMAGYIILLSVILVMILLGINWTIKYMVLNYTKISAENNLMIVSNGIENSLKNAESAANLIMIGFNSIDFLKNEQPPANFSIREQNQVESQLNYGTSSFRDVSYTLFVDKFGHVYCSDIPMQQQFEKSNTKDLIEKIKLQSSQSAWLEMDYYPSFIFNDSQRNMAILTKKVIDINSGDYMGSLFVMITEGELSKNYQYLGMTANSTYTMINNKNIVVSATARDLMNQPYSFGRPTLHNRTLYISGKEYIQSEKDIDQLGVSLIYNVPVDELMPDKTVIFTYMVLSALVLFLVALYLSAKLSGFLSKPILKLSDTIQEIRTNHGAAHIENKNHNEIAVLENNFHSMMEEIDQLIVKVQQEQTEKRKHEFALIQSQIRPHFLYNTLDTAYVLAHLGQVENAKTTIKALADFYRVALSSGKEEISIEKELKNLKDYLKIQSIRYHDIFTYEIHVPESLYDYSILKLSIQPLVENSIYHGLKEAGRFGYVKIYGEDLGDDILITVEDNGVGMSQKRIQNLLSDTPKDSFGLQNVRNRLRLYYGEKYGITIQVTTVTKVMILLPKMVSTEE